MDTIGHQYFTHFKDILINSPIDNEHQLMKLMTSMVCGKNVMTKLTWGGGIKETVSVISNDPLYKYRNLSYAQQYP